MEILVGMLPHRQSVPLEERMGSDRHPEPEVSLVPEVRLGQEVREERTGRLLPKVRKGGQARPGISLPPGNSNSNNDKLKTEPKERRVTEGILE